VIDHFEIKFEIDSFEKSKSDHFETRPSETIIGWPFWNELRFWPFWDFWVSDPFWKKQFWPF